MVGKGTSGGECYGTYDSTSGTGSGPGYVNACIHSGSNEYSGGNTVWYNYAATTAGTIKNSSGSDTTGNTATATESICPKGWSLPTIKQINNVSGGASGSTTYISSFLPVLGGIYEKGVLYYDYIRGFWWGSETFNGIRRYTLYYTGEKIASSTDYVSQGFYIRCVSEEKDVSDLTYMQDMTPSVATFAAERTTLPTILQELCVIVNVLRA